LYSAVLDDRWPHEAISESWAAARGARLTLFVTFLALGFLTFIAAASVYCLVGIVLLPMVSALWQAGFTAAWLLHRRSAEEIRSWPFFEQHGLP
jgi:hypothetical protein